MLDSREPVRPSPGDPRQVIPRPAIRGVITDWGGVMTGPIRDMVRVWLDEENIDYRQYAAVMRPWIFETYDAPGDGNPIHALERGECTTVEFEELLAARIVRRDGSNISPDGLLGRMFSGSAYCDPMHAVFPVVREAGLRTGLLSNSWGVADYPREKFPGLFDVVVISGEVGMRKPEERIFRHTAGLLGLTPQECVFIDDLEVNVAAAEAVGMTAVLHDDPAVTIARLGDILGLPLTG